MRQQSVKIHALFPVLPASAEGACRRANSKFNLCKIRVICGNLLFQETLCGNQHYQREKKTNL